MHFRQKKLKEQCKALKIYFFYVSKIVATGGLQYSIQPDVRFIDIILNPTGFLCFLLLTANGPILAGARQALKHAFLFDFYKEAETQAEVKEEREMNQESSCLYRNRA